MAGLILLLTDRRFPVGAAAAIVAMAVSFAIGGSVVLYMTVLLVVLPGAIIAACVRFNKDAVFSIFIVLVPIALLCLVYFAQVGDTESFFQDRWPEIESDFRTMAEDLGLKPESEEVFEQAVDLTREFMRYLLRFLPALVLTVFTIISAGAYILAGYGFKREGRYLLPLPRYNHWKIKEFVMVIFGVGLIFVLLGNGIVEDVGENVALYTFFLFSFGGISIVEYILRKQKVAWYIKALVYFGIVIMNIYSAIILGIAGLIDSHFDFRRLRALRIG